MGETSCAEETPPYGVNLRPSRHPKKISGASDHSRRFAVASWISVALMAMILLVVYLGDNPRLFRRYRH
jgi:type VI protein secretion system component VasF